MAIHTSHRHTIKYLTELEPMPKIPPQGISAQLCTRNSPLQNIKETIECLTSTEYT